MIIATNPLKWRKANWTDLRAYVAECAAVTLHPENYPARYWPKKVSTKDALEDLRRLVWLKEHPQAGQIDDSILEFALPELDPGEPIYKYRGEWIVTTYDIFLKRWFWWVNKEDKTRTQANIMPEPPSFAKIWLETTTYRKGAYVIDPYDMFSYQSLEDNNAGNSPHGSLNKWVKKSNSIHPNDLPNWEEKPYNVTEAWSYNTPYVINNESLASDGYIYRSKVGTEENPNLDHDPVADTTHTYWDCVGTEENIVFYPDKVTIDGRLGEAEPYDPKKRYCMGDSARGSDGFKYVSKVGTIASPNIGNDPVGDTVHWEIPSITDGVAYKAKIPITGDDIHIPPPQNKTGWEKWANWYIEDANWYGIPNPNFYHDFDTNSPYLFIKQELNGGLENLIDCPPQWFYPPQDDARRIFDPVRFADTGLTLFQYKSKVKSPEITDPQTLGPVFDIWDRFAIQDAYSDPPVPYIVSKPPGKLLYRGAYLGGQYSNYDSLNRNSPGLDAGMQRTEPYEWSYNPKVKKYSPMQNKIECILSDNCWRILADEVYKANWRIWKGLAVGAEVTEETDWLDYVLLVDPRHGDNESGFECAMRRYGKYDWYFDSVYPYVPFYDAASPAKSFVCYLKSLSGDLETHKTEYNMRFAGTFRRTWKHGMGRKSPFMRSLEMGEPTHLRDTFTKVSPLDQKEYTWFGARTNDFPPISEFDPENSFADITAKQTINNWVNNTEYDKGTKICFNIISADNFNLNTGYVIGDVVKASNNKYYISKVGTQQNPNLGQEPATYQGWEWVKNLCYRAKVAIEGASALLPPPLNTDWEVVSDYKIEIDGDKTNILKPGWVIHLCQETSDLISNGEFFLNWAYIMSLKYNSETSRTEIILHFPEETTVNSRVLACTKIGWNANISKRHDGIGITRDSNGTVTPLYQLTAEMLVEMYDVLEYAKYVDYIMPELDVNLGTWPNDRGQGEDGEFYKADSVGDYVGRLTSKMSSEFGYEIEIEKGWFSDAVDVGSFIQAGGYTPYEYNREAPLARHKMFSGMGWFSAMVISGTWVGLKNPPKYIIVQFLLHSIIDYSGNGMLCTPCSAGGISAPPLIQQGQQVKYYRRHLRLNANGDKHFLIPPMIPPYDVYITSVEQNDYDENGDLYFPYRPRTWLTSYLGGSTLLGIQAVLPDSFIEIENITTPDSVFENGLLVHHIDAALTLDEDIKPPLPNPPIFEEKSQVYYKVILPYGPGKTPENPEFWSVYGLYPAGSYVLDSTQRIVFNGEAFYILYHAINDDYANKGIYDPMYWEKIPFSFEKRIRAEIGKCVDDESLSNPVRYRLIGEGDAPTGAWTENQEVEITIEALAIEDVIGTIILDDTVVSYPGGTVVRIPLNATGLIAGMTVVFINGWPVPNNVVIAAVDPNFQWIEIDWGWSDPYEPIRFPNNSRMLFGKIREDNWSSDPAANYKFACQAKDNATPQNVGLPSEFAQVAAPDEWPMDIWINL